MRYHRAGIHLAIIGMIMLHFGASVCWAASKLEVWVPDWGWAAPDELKALVDEFAKRHPEIQVESLTPVAGWDTYLQKLVVSAASGLAPDVAFYNRATVLENVVLLEAFEPIDQMLGKDLTAQLIPGFVQEVSVAGRTYALPFYADMRGVWWNVEHLNEAGLDSSRPPSFDALTSYNQKLTRYNGNRLTRVGFYPWGNNWYVQGWYFAFGGDVFDWQQGRPTINHPLGKQVFEFFAEYALRYPELGTGDWGNEFAAFTQDRRSIILAATDFRRNALKANPSLNLSGGPAPYRFGGRSGTWAGGGAWVVPKGAKHTPEAALFLRYLASAETMLRYHNAVQGISPNRQATQRQRFTDLAAAAIVQDAGNLNPRPPLWAKFNSILGNWRTQVIQSKASVVQALENAQLQLETAFAEAGLTTKWK